MISMSRPADLDTSDCEEPEAVICGVCDGSGEVGPLHAGRPCRACWGRGEQLTEAQLDARAEAEERRWEQEQDRELGFDL